VVRAVYGEEVGRIFSRYGRRKREAQALDLDDLLLYWRPLASHQVAGAPLAAMFDHLLVDEYQDVNELQSTSSRRCVATTPA
jgi:DNA helicase-2/ATP-dependent DNA helicase PcrA